MRLITAAASLALLLCTPALAHEGDHTHGAPRSGAQPASDAHGEQPASHDEPHGQEEGPDTEHMFGFTTGTDVLDKGHVEAESEVESSFGKRVGHYHVDGLRNTFKFAPLDGFSVELGASANRFSIHNVPGFDNRSFTGFGGVSWAPEGVAVRNPAFDVTPAALITALVTERGVAHPPDAASIAALLA